MSKSVKILLCFTLMSLMLLILLCGYASVIYVNSVRTQSIPHLISGHSEKQTVLNDLYLEKTTHTLSNKEYKHLIETELNLKLYSYQVKELPNDNGKCNLYFRIIRINTGLSGVHYARTFTHEAMHLKHCTENELFVCYETFKFLYKSDNKYLHNAGVIYAIDNLTHNVAEEYNITNQIMYYFLIEKGANNV